MSPFHARRYVGWATILTSELPNTFAALAAGAGAGVAGDARRPRDRVAVARAPRRRRPPARAPARANWGIVRSRPRRRSWPTASTRKARRPRCAARSPTAASPCARPRRRWPGSPPCSRSRKESPAYAALLKAADTARSRGDQRGRGQVMADTLVQRLTGQATAADVPVEINLIMTTDTLLNPGRRPSRRTSTATDRCPRRSPATSRWPAPRRGGSGGCSPAPTPDSSSPWSPGAALSPPASGGSCKSTTSGAGRPTATPPSATPTTSNPPRPAGATHVHNGRGTCEACNYTNQSPGWHSYVDTVPGDGREVEITTPTGHRYRSRPPDLPGTSRLAS